MTSDFPLVLDRGILTDLLRSTIGTSTAIAEYHVVLRREDYAVVVVTLVSPALSVVVKLAGPQAPIACPFDRTEAIVALVRRHTSVPTFNVLACDVSYREWPWRYMVMTHMPGTTWRAAQPDRVLETQRGLYQALGHAVGQLHTIHFPAFGEIDTSGGVSSGSLLISALEQRAVRRIVDARHVALFSSVLRERAAAFAQAPGPVLCHEDLNPHNLLLQHDAGSWQITAILDFDSAWAGCPESDLARLDLWRGMMGEGFREAYEAITPLAPGYWERRPVYQLLWCLEFADPSPQHLDDTAGVCAELGIPLVTFAPPGHR
jgi:aminoglycoside phosphotransferase (APT) family kinase protein